MVEVFREVRRVLRKDGTLWLNMGDSYNTAKSSTMKTKDLVGMPWMLALALRADGWYLRQDIIWSKPNPMPESVIDRCTKAHEYLFLMSKSPRYYFNYEAILEPVSPNNHARLSQNVAAQTGSTRAHDGGKTNGNMKAVGRGVNPKARVPSGWDTTDSDHKGMEGRYPRPKANESFSAAISGSLLELRNKRSVWEIPTQPYSEAHFATYPEDLVEPCILAASRPKGKHCHCMEVIQTPTGEVSEEDPTMEVGRAGMSRIRTEGSGRRPIYRIEQQGYAKQLRESEHRALMEAEAGPAFKHYIRTDRAGARPVPPILLDLWTERGWVMAPANTCNCPDKPADIVLDPFCGSGTTGVVALRYHRAFVGIELNPRYAELALKRVGSEAPLFNDVSVLAPGSAFQK